MDFIGIICYTNLGQKYLKHDNDSSAKTKLEWFKSRPQSENLGEDLKITVHQHFPCNLTELKQFCQEEWAKVLGYR